MNYGTAWIVSVKVEFKTPVYRLTLAETERRERLYDVSNPENLFPANMVETRGQ